MLYSAKPVTDGKRATYITAIIRTFFQGIAASKGIAKGIVYVFERKKHDALSASEPEMRQEYIQDEIARWHLALERSTKELEKIAHITEQKLAVHTLKFSRRKL
ncbi:MAG: hypothetical protein CMR00_09110 [[Chlorobium] sp. 445]|nr:MAG: hypothetical protein CMR00_09110 [[Chlorobium] sp. 445]